MQICKVKNYQELSRKAANLIAAQIILKPDSILGLATGSSPVGTYEHLVEMYENGDLDFSQVTTVNLDEYKGLAGSDEQSYRYFMNTHLFHKININHANTYVPNGTEPDAEKACQAYNELLHKIGPADIQILGLGHDGHIGFNEPCCIYVKKRKWRFLRIKSLHCKMKHYRTVFSYRIKHYRLLALCCNFTDDINCLCFQLIQM